MNDGLEQIREVLRCFPEVELAIVFGSMTSGRLRWDSDIDLAVWASVPLSADTMLAWMDALAESLGRPVDLIDLRTVGEPLLGEIVSRGVQVMGSPSRMADMVFRHVMLVADFLPLRNRLLAERRKRWINR